MSKLSDMLPTKGQYLKAVDVPDGASMKLTIDKIEHEKMPGREGEQEEENKPVVYFSGKDRGLVLNRTNLDMLISLFSDDVGAIVGKEVVVFRTFASFSGQTVPALRIRGIDAKQGEDIPF